MQIQAISNQNFGRIYIENKKQEKELIKAVLLSSGDEDTYKEIIADLIHAISSKKNDVYVKEDGTVLAKGDHTENKFSQMGGPNFLERFLLGLRVARTDEYQSHLSNFRRNRSTIIDI